MIRYFKQRENLMSQLEGSLQRIIQNLESRIMSQEEIILKSSSASITNAALVNIVNGYDNYAYEDTTIESRSPPIQSVSNLTFNSASECDEITLLRVIDDNQSRHHNHQSTNNSQRSSPTSLSKIENYNVQNSAQLKFVNVKRDSVETNYGYSFKTFKEKDKHFINLVRDNTVAHTAGLRQGDQIVEVNGEPVSGLSHRRVVSIMRRHPLDLNLTLISDLNSYQECFRELLDNLRQTELQLIEERTPRIYELSARPDLDGFGFTVRNSVQAPHFILSVQGNSPASDAGLRSGQMLTKLNDHDISSFQIEKVILLIHKGFVEERKLKVEAVTSKEDLPRLCVFEERVDKLGFSLVGVRSIKGVFKVDKVKEGSAAKQAGLRNDDFIVEISGKSVNMCEYDDVMQLIKTHNEEGDLNLLVADRQAWFKMNNLVSNIDNSHVPMFKRCFVSLRPPYKGYGFRLFKDKDLMPKHVICSLDPNSPSFDANLRETDVVVEINGVNVRRLKTSKVQKLIDASQDKGSIEILAIENKDYIMLKQSGQKLSSKSLPNPANTLVFRNDVPNKIEESDEQAENQDLDNDKDEEPPVPRLCSFTKVNKNTDLGFDLLTSKTLEGVVKLNKIVDGSAATLAGIREDDYVIEITGEPVRHMSGRQIIELVRKRKAENNLQFLVIDRTGLEWYEKRKIRITNLIGMKDEPEELEVRPNEPEVRSDILPRNVSFVTEPSQGKSEIDYDYFKIILNKGKIKEPLGFTLEMCEEFISKNGKKKRLKSHNPTIATVEENSLGELSGLKNGDVILEINGKRTAGESNKKVSDWIKKSKKNQVEFLIRREVKMNDRVVVEIIGEDLEPESDENKLVSLEIPFGEESEEDTNLGKDNQGFEEGEKPEFELKILAKNLADEAVRSSLVIVKDESL